MERTLICETVSSATTADLRLARDGSAADLVELRLDGMRELDVAGALAGRRTPVVVTCRPVWQGGRFSGSESERLAILQEAARLGAEYIDLEWQADRRGFPVDTATRLVLSHHDFGGVPADLTDILRAMAAEAPAIVKIAITPRRLVDCAALRDAVADIGPHVAIAMGSMGVVTRVCPALFGSCWTYAGAAAPGQLSVETLVDVYCLRRQSGPAVLYGVAGAPLSHSASPAMHNAAFAHLGLDAVYVPLETGDADDLLEAARRLGVAGLSVTAPLKGVLAQTLDHASALVEETGAVNTLRWSPAGLEGENFDVAGFLDPLAGQSVILGGARAVILGAGGAARSVAKALADAGASVEVASRRPEAAAVLARSAGAAVGTWPPRPDWDLLVNCTPVGTAPNDRESPLPRSCLRGRCVYDLVYNPPETTLLRWAREAGITTIGGLGMLAGQARRQIHWWTGQEVPAAILDAAARRFLASEDAQRQQR